MSHCHRKPLAWAVASGFWYLKPKPWAVTGLSDGLWWPWLPTAQLGRLKALSLSRHNTSANIMFIISANCWACCFSLSSCRFSFSASNSIFYSFPSYLFLSNSCFFSASSNSRNWIWYFSSQRSAISFISCMWSSSNHSIVILLPHFFGFDFLSNFPLLSSAAAPEWKEFVAFFLSSWVLVES